MQPRRRVEAAPAVPINETECEAQRALRHWIDTVHGGNVARAARQIDISWMYLSRLLDGSSRPSIDVVFRCKEIALVAITSWRISVRRTLKQAVNA